MAANLLARGRTLAHVASIRGDMVTSLIVHGVDWNVHDNIGITPLFCASFYGHADVTAAL